MLDFRRAPPPPECQRERRAGAWIAVPTRLGRPRATGAAATPGRRPVAPGRWPPRCGPRPPPRSRRAGAPLVPRDPAWRRRTRTPLPPPARRASARRWRTDGRHRGPAPGCPRRRRPTWRRWRGASRHRRSRRNPATARALHRAAHPAPPPGLRQRPGAPSPRPSAARACPPIPGSPCRPGPSGCHRRRRAAGRRCAPQPSNRMPSWPAACSRSRTARTSGNSSRASNCAQ